MWVGAVSAHAVAWAVRTSVARGPVVVLTFDGDGLTEACYARPERFLDPITRRAQSVWGFVDEQAVDRVLGRLRADLAAGERDRCYGALRRRPEFVRALRVITARPI